MKNNTIREEVNESLPSTDNWSTEKSEGSLTCVSPFDVMSSAGRQGVGGASGLFPEPDDDLPELLSELGLGKYIDTFQEQEIDFQTFLTLSDEDLKEVGVLTFEARRKMLLAITGQIRETDYSSGSQTGGRDP
ncbi:protein bicaudal C homolog 1-A-like [Engraulis encrasicolus]|uniref:protein bicaudal C homolog 1-A-like n=1 Tax=Engraulis encrasicolus TaxID=184585 RepID=UPI002FCFB002